MSYLLPANLSQSVSSHQEVSVVSCLSCLLFAYLFSLLCLCLPGCEWHFSFVHCLLTFIFACQDVSATCLSCSSPADIFITLSLFARLWVLSSVHSICYLLTFISVSQDVSVVPHSFHSLSADLFLAPDCECYPSSISFHYLLISLSLSVYFSGCKCYSLFYFLTSHSASA